MTNERKEHNLAKLTSEQALEIYTSTDKQVDLAKRFGVSQTTVSIIKRGDVWGWLTKDVEKPEIENCGSRKGNSKLNEEKVKAILNDHSYMREIAEKYDVSITTIYKIKNRHIWKHVKP